MKGENSKSDQAMASSSNQRRIGITGGIASGKSSISRYLEEVKKLPILDADTYAKELLAPETIFTDAVIKRYGNEIINSRDSKKTSINRIILRKIIFNSKAEREWLGELLHPSIIQKIKSDIKKLKNEPILILVIPLLFELKLNNMCSEIWVVSCTYAQQIERLINRDKISKIDAIEMIRSQIPLEVKEKMSNIIIDNGSHINEWRKQVNNIL